MCRWPIGRNISSSSSGSVLPTQRCTVHKHRNLLAHAPDQLQDNRAQLTSVMVQRPLGMLGIDKWP